MCLEAGPRHARVEFGGGQHAHVRGIAQPLDRVLKIQFGGVRRGHDVDDHGGPAAAKHPEHLAEGALRIGKMMDREAGHDAVELPIRERQVLRIAAV